MRRPKTHARAPVIEKIDVSVVNVDVTVTDRAGNPVRGLTRDDFEVFEDGRPQPITNFYAVEHAPAANIAAMLTLPGRGEQRLAQLGLRVTF